MKKILYFVALAVAAIGCAKEETGVELPESRDIAVSISADNVAVKAIYDGANHIAFQSGDAFYAAIAKKDEPTTGICVATASGRAASVYYSKFTIADATAQEPEFKGNLFSIVEDDFAPEYNFYGIFPISAVYNTSYLEDDLTEWLVNIPDSQEATQTAWASKADAMVIQPLVISTSENTYDEQYKEYSTSQNEKIQFSHLFGFGKFTFAGVPAEYASLPVKSIVIEAIGDNKDFVGSYEIDITKDINDITPVPYSAKSVLTLKADGTIPVSEYVAWFVANPGMFDIRVTVMTARADLIFERQGLNIRRASIAAPTLNFKGTDVAKSHNVVLENNEMWAIAPFTSSNALTSTYNERKWGPAGKEMTFSLAYPESGNSNYGSSMYVTNGVYYQKLASQNIQGGKVVLSSAASFSGVKMVKVTLGNGTKDVTNDFTISLINGENVYNLGKVSVTGVASPFAPESFYFKTNEGETAGDLVITADNFSNTNSMPYMVDLTINPAPDIVCDDQVKLDIAAGSGEIELAVYGADGDPEVTDDAEWVNVTYADGKISYSYEANVGPKRTAAITVKATGLATTTKTILVSQKSATAIEYRLSFTATQMYEFILAKKSELEADGTTVGQYSNYPVEATFTATATDGSGKTMSVAVYADKINIYNSSDSSFRSSSGSLKCVNPIGSITKMSCSADQKFNTSNYSGMAANLSVNGTQWVKMTDFTVEGTSAPYTNTVSNSNEDYVYFDFKGNSTTNFYSVEVTFIAD